MGRLRLLKEYCDNDDNNNDDDDDYVDYDDNVYFFYLSGKPSESHMFKVLQGSCSFFFQPKIKPTPLSWLILVEKQVCCPQGSDILL